MISNTRRKACIVCGAQLLEDLVYIGDQYPSAIFPKVDEDYKSVIQTSSLNLTKCSNNDCGLVQLAQEYNLDHVFKNYPFVSGSTATMKNILADVVKDMECLLDLGENDVVLDIGGNDGTLLGILKKDVKAKINIDAAHGIESVISDSNYFRVQNKYSSKVYLELDQPLPKMIFSIAMFYHLNDPVSFCENVKEIMTDDTVWCIQMTYLGSMLDSNIYDNIVHEHVAHYSLKSLEFLLNKTGLEIFDAKVVQSYGGSIRVKVRKKRSLVLEQSVSNNIQSIKKYELRKDINTVEALERFNERINIIKDFTRELIFHIVDKYGKIVALGASTKGNMICQLNGFNQDYIECVLDNNEKKIGLIMTGSDIPIVDENKYFSNLPEYLFVLPYYYIDFFKIMIKKHLKKGQNIYMVIPLPKPHFIKLSGDNLVKGVRP